MMQWYDYHQELDRTEGPKLLFTSENNIDWMDLYDLEKGLPVTDWRDGAKIWSDSAEYDGIPADLHHDVKSIPIVSARLKAALERAGVGIHDVQYLPVEVLQSTGQSNGIFYFMNVITMVVALDRRKCFLLDEDDHIDPATGLKHVSGVGRAALRGKALRGHDVIRLREFFPPVFVSERFARVLEENGFAEGTLLSPVEVT
jgi:hypothetical protein